MARYTARLSLMAMLLFLVVRTSIPDCQPSLKKCPVVKISNQEINDQKFYAATVSPYSNRSTSARQLASMMFALAPTGAPALMMILRIDQHTRHGFGAVVCRRGCELL